MNRRFARLNYAESKDDIAIKYKILKKAPAKVFDWYINKFNPYKIDDAEFLGQDGYNINLPIIESAAELEPERAAMITEKTILSLLEHNVDILLLPSKGPEIPHPNNISIATGKNIIPFFLSQAIKKALKTLRKDIKTAEMLVIAGGKYTESVLYNIYEEINYLSVMVPDGDVEKYKDISEWIFGDNGLNIQMTGLNKSVLGTADIVINAGEMDEKFFYGFKRGAVCLDICGGGEKRKELIRKRNDILVVDDFRLKLEDEAFTVAECEMAFYLISKEYRAIFLRGYDHDIAQRAKKQLKDMNIKLASFKRLGSVISSAAISNALYS